MERTLKYSRQREAILESLRSRYDHPTAEQLYIDLKAKYPKISLGTVYRNLALLESIGDIVKISTNAESDRFDGCAENHYHLACTKCGGVSDVDMPVNAGLDAIAEKYTKAEIKTHSLIFYGVCENCRKKGLTK